MKFPTSILRLALIATMSGAFLLLGAVVGRLLFASSSGHGLAGLGGLLNGAGVGLVIGLLVAVMVCLKCGVDRTRLLKVIAASVLAVLVLLGLIALLDARAKW